MNTSKSVAVITPVLTKDVSFTEKVEAVDTALKSRAAAQREIKLAWAAVVQVLNKYELKVPSRRMQADLAAALVQDTTVYEPKLEVADDVRKMLESGVSYRLTNLAECANFLRLADAKLPGLRQLIDDLVEAKSTLEAPLVKDKEKTKAARAELASAVDAYIETLEAYDQTIESVANVKEYIGIMKEIADISAIAQGIKTNN